MEFVFHFDPPYGSVLVIHRTTVVLLPATSPEIKLVCRVVIDKPGEPGVLFYVVPVMPVVSKNAAPHWFVNLPNTVRTLRVVCPRVMETLTPAY